MQRRWDDQEGRKRSKIEVVANNVQYLGGKGEPTGAADGGTKVADKDWDKQPPIEDDDIPF